MKRISAFALALLSVSVLVRGDVYMHMPRGSNDRNCERNVNRDNENRLFDSNNNAKGGYACPRAVGSETIQPESDVVTQNGITQNKRMYYYSGSILPVEWTNQHGCGVNSKVNCEIVMQYACGDILDPKVDNFWPWTDGKNGASSVTTKHFGTSANVAAPRDGVPNSASDAATDTIPDDEASAKPSTETTRRYGMQESYDYYQVCQHTSRNLGLYTADQNVRRNDQRGTRQNPNGNRHGFECPEERDYYPWWSPSPWIDAAIMTNDANATACNTMSSCATQRCKYYMNNTFNTKDKCYCDVEHTSGSDATKKTTNTYWTNRKWFINEADCTSNGFTWYCVNFTDNLTSTLANPTCVLTHFSRINHLGNANPSNGDGNEEIQNTNYATPSSVLGSIPVGTNANRFFWAVPSIPTASASYSTLMSTDYTSCVMRIRYNITTSDFPVWPDEALPTNSDYRGKMVDSNNNSRSTDDPRTPLKQDPFITIGPGVSDGTAPQQFVALKVNTNQYGRTFEDRSYVFAIKALPTTDVVSDDTADTPYVPGALITSKIASGSGLLYNIGVRGKRGNIVQTYPAVEYDFTPNSLMLSTSDMVHFQWTGSDYNPQRGCNDATGGPPDPNDYVDNANNNNARADRSNVCFKSAQSFERPMTYITETSTTTYTYAERLANAEATITPSIPCYDSTGTSVTTSECWNMAMRLCYLNQDSDALSLSLRNDETCLTQTELNAITDENLRDNHPLNCAKMNAKPYPYMDAGVVPLMQSGIYRYFSSRNNNFSNRDQSGVLCVNPSASSTYCATNYYNYRYSILQDNNPFDKGVYSAASTASTTTATCIEQASTTNTGNTDGAKSCISYGSTTSNTLTSETFHTQNSDSDAKGTGDKKGCNVLTSWWTDSTTSVVEAVGLAIGLLFVGLFVSWAAYYGYNRYKARAAAGSKFGGDKTWQKKPKTNEMI